ncbi:hypothetical protein RhiirA4_482409 [Rhizophagus irregularis]|uniref:Uncharacterized protein n=1 Tax=Rhizophagus irregularis TaxID=588596 RepID=A0A2I1HL06_9GLOM|nr:hypothetical protein RhiirA4_482409 [Rhizophagus irregularis]
MAKHLEVPVTLLTLSTINENLHYGPFACYWHNAGSGYSSSLLHFYNKKQVLFVSRIVDNKCIIEIYQQAQKIKIIHGSTPSEVWRKSWFMEKYDGSELYGLKDQKTQN